MHDVKARLVQKIKHMQRELNTIEETVVTWMAEQPQFAGQSAQEVRLVAEGYVQRVREPLTQLARITHYPRLKTNA